MSQHLKHTAASAIATMGGLALLLLTAPSALAQVDPGPRPIDLGPPVSAVPVEQGLDGWAVVAIGCLVALVSTAATMAAMRLRARRTA